MLTFDFCLFEINRSKLDAYFFLYYWFLFYVMIFNTWLRKSFSSSSKILLFIPHHIVRNRHLSPLMSCWGIWFLFFFPKIIDCIYWFTLERFIFLFLVILVPIHISDETTYGLSVRLLYIDKSPYIGIEHNNNINSLLIQCKILSKRKRGKKTAQLFRWIVGCLFSCSFFFFFFIPLFFFFSFVTACTHTQDGGS